MFSRGGWVVAAGLLVVAPAGAQQLTASGATRIDPFLDALFAHRARFGETLPPFARSDRFERAGTLPVVVRFASPPSARLRAHLRARGVAWHWDAPLASGAWGAFVDARGARELAVSPEVLHAEVDLPRRGRPPLDAAARETRVEPARRALRLADGTELDGRGALVVALDTGIFVFHPGLFRADAGVFPWIDADRDGALDPGLDGVDLDRDGVLAPHERLRVITGAAYTRYGRFLDGAASGFRPDRDWLYLDTNGNGRRDWGRGFSEETPAYGEPLFVADDADHDGRLDHAERLLRLGTSKLRGVIAQRDYLRGGPPGSALVEYDPDAVLGGAAAVQHATGVAGIVVGGTPGVSRWLGLAPGADLLVIDANATAARFGLTGAIQRALEMGADVVLTEFAWNTGITLDGSTEVDLQLDAALARGAVVVGGAGNEADGRWHRTIGLGDSPVSVFIRVAERYDGIGVLACSLHLRDSTRSLELSITLPDGATAPLTPDGRGADALGRGRRAYAIPRVSRRGTREWHVSVHDPAGFAAGAYLTLTLTPGAGPPATADLYVEEAFTVDASGPERTLCYPATGDGTLAVGAYTLHDETGFDASSDVGDLARYSSRGPRIDGDPGLDLLAPDNPMSLLPIGHVRSNGAYAPFGGTSGASAHVAAAAALLRQRFPPEPATVLRARLVNSARHDAFVRRGREDLHGRGKLDVAAALGLEPPQDGRPPTVTLRAPRNAPTSVDVTLALEVLDDGPLEELRVRWDTDYDGRYDTGWERLGPRTLRTPTTGDLAVRVEVLDRQGHVGGAAARVTVGEDARPGCSCGVRERAAPWRAVGAVGALAFAWAMRRRRNHRALPRPPARA